MELNKKTMQRIMLLITFAVLLFWGLYNISTIGGLFSNLFSLLAPLLIGVCIAFVLNLMMVGLERLWDRALAKWRSRWNAKLKHLLHPHPPSGGGGQHAGGQYSHLR